MKKVKKFMTVLFMFFAVVGFSACSLLEHNIELNPDTQTSSMVGIWVIQSVQVQLTDPAETVVFTIENNVWHTTSLRDNVYSIISEIPILTTMVFNEDGTVIITTSTIVNRFWSKEDNNVLISTVANDFSNPVQTLILVNSTTFQFGSNSIITMVKV